jgi:hypothetical protein
MERPRLLPESIPSGQTVKLNFSRCYGGFQVDEGIPYAFKEIRA